jgi:hypothetical protein
MELALDLQLGALAAMVSGPPVNTLAPSIAVTSGKGFVGSTYTATPGTWSGGTVTGQWLADGVAIPGQTASTYVMTLTNEGKVIKYRETNGAVTADSNTLELWMPTDLGAALKRWYDALSITGLNDGDAMASWADLSPVGSALTQATGSLKPFYKAAGRNGKPSVLFDGVDDIMNSSSNMYTGTADSFMFGLGYLDTASQNTRSLMSTGVAANGQLREIGTDFFLNAQVGIYGGDYAPASNGWSLVDKMMGWNHTGATHTHDVRINGNAATTNTPAQTTNTNTQGLSVGSRIFGGAPWSGHAQMLMALTRLATVGEQQKIEGFAAHRYNVAGLLPSGHTYKAAPPFN